MDKKLERITRALHDKAGIKQTVYQNTVELFTQLRNTCNEVSDQLNKDKSFGQENIDISVTEINEFEFHFKLGGDLLVFMMQTNIFAFPGYHHIYKSKYMKADPKRSFFGQVLVYNFLADSVKYDRQNDMGYLIERIFINNDKHFFIEGMRKLNFTYPDISRNKITKKVLKEFVSDAIIISIETDLVMSSFEENFMLSIEQKIQNRSAKIGSKLGFRLNARKE